MTLRRLQGTGDLWVGEAEVRDDGGDPLYGV